MAFCIKCGNELPDDAAFCNKCGQKILVTEDKTEQTKDTGEISSENDFDSSKPASDVSQAKEKKEPNRPLVSFFMPYLGVYYIFKYWKDDSKKAKSCLIATIISLVLLLITGRIGMIIALPIGALIGAFMLAEKPSDDAPKNQKFPTWTKIALIVMVSLVLGLGAATGVLGRGNSSSSRTSNGSTSVKDITDDPPVASGLTLNSYHADVESTYFTVKGTITTRTIAKNGLYINVTAYDENQNKMQTYSDTSPQLSAGETWSFAIPIYSEDVAYYAVTTVNYN
ncbi:MAG: zinc-ribbon domain-containing protein [Oscillospiraceae bacterium]|nr:zinc-ribbon domain-containing protein [Oscillospiraceae bacterium]